MSTKAKRWAKLLGHGLAHVQDGVDFAVDIGFKAMKKAASSPSPSKSNENKYVRTGKKVGKELLGFLGEAGDSFYKKYEELKKERSS